MADLICIAIQKALDDNEGCLIGRNGTIELDLMMTDAHSRDGRPFLLEKHAGIFPMNRDGTLGRWRAAAIAATKAADVLAAGWYEPLRKRETEFLVKEYVHARLIGLRDLEPYYVPYYQQWTRLLEGHKVAVLTSFAQSAAEQIVKAEEIWGSHGVLPRTCDWAFLQTGHPPCLAQGLNEWPAGIWSWEDAVEFCVARVIRSGARFCLIGCGGIGMIVAHRLKERGIICIVLGGAIQVLFGIKGRRWEKHDVISKFWNDAWVWPKLTETPRGASQIEGGCYWGL